MVKAKNYYKNDMGDWIKGFANSYTIKSFYGNSKIRCFAIWTLIIAEISANKTGSDITFV